FHNYVFERKVIEEFLGLQCVLYRMLTMVQLNREFSLPKQVYAKCYESARKTQIRGTFSD
ncbi:hypothetical protein, partial [Bacteroides caccae]|uniref:hypothetical protein n=1 Tax=Bacteroides caccae TaxID=47678 RepID=UPI001961F275